MEQQKPEHWGFSAVMKTVAEHGNIEEYTCASGITPSGVVHIGNVREYITVDIVRRAFKYSGKNARHIHSWDDFDVFRKVPENMPEQGMLERHLRMCIVDVPDPYGEYESYAMRHIRDVEDSVRKIGIAPAYLYQSRKYRNCEYADEIKKALESTQKIAEILNRHRSEDIKEGWLPVSIFCGKCKRDTIKNIAYPGGYELEYECECGWKEKFDFRNNGIVKLKWRVDWPMRWAHEKVNFEPGGRDHSTVGGSYDTGKQIVEEVWGRRAPTYIVYEFIKIKGMSGKMSSSKGNIATLNDCLEVYEPEVVRYLFAGTRPEAEFDISFDADVIKIYEDYDKCERAYYGLEETGKREKEKWIYIFSQVNDDVGSIPKEMPFRVGFRHITTILQINGLEEERAYTHLSKGVKNENDMLRLRARIRCAKNWLSKYADEQFKFSMRTAKVGKDEFTQDEFAVLAEVRKAILESADEEGLASRLFAIPKGKGMEQKDFFKLCYRAIIGKDRGPKLAGFIMDIGKEKVADILPE